MSERTAFFHQLGIKAYGVRHLHNNCGKSAFGVASHTIGIGAEIVVGRVGFEYGNVLFAAEEYNFFIVSGNAFNFHGSAVTYADLQFHTEIISYGYVVKTAIKGDFFHGYACGYNIHAFGSYRRCVIYNVLHRVGKLNLKVLKAVFITCGIKYSVYVDLNDMNEIICYGVPTEGTVIYSYGFKVKDDSYKDHFLTVKIFDAYGNYEEYFSSASKTKFVGNKSRYMGANPTNPEWDVTVEICTSQGEVVYVEEFKISECRELNGVLLQMLPK